MKSTRALLVAVGFVLCLSSSLLAQRGRRPNNPGATWAHDGQHVVFENIWYEPLTWRKRDPIPEPGSHDASPRELLIAALSKARGEAVSPRALQPSTRGARTLPRRPVDNPGAQFSDDGERGVCVIDGELWVWRAGTRAQKVADDLAGIRHFEMAPDGSAVSYLSDDDLYVSNTANGERMRVTDDGSENIFNGELDWVYQEEVYGRGNFKGTWWSPDSRHLAYIRIDETGVDTFTVVDHIPDQLALDTIKYPKAGRINPRATLAVARADDGGVVPIDLGKYRPEDQILVVRVGWTPSGDWVVFMVQDREQTWLDLDFADPETGAVRTVIHESCDDGWVNRLPMPRWLADGSFLWESQRTGFNHFYRYRRDGTLIATVTRGEWRAGRIIRLDEDGGWIAFSGTTEDYAIGQNAYRATLDGKSLVRLTAGRGDHRVSFNADGTLLLDAFSSMENPGEQWLRKADGKVVRQVFKRKVPEGTTPPQWRQIHARDGETLDVAYTLPRGFDPTKKYPVWISTYSGPNSPSVRDSWRGSGRGSDWYVLLQVNVRSASGRGMKYTKTCYRQFGVQELADIEDAIDWLCKNNTWADPSRVGITGSSYGGFMTAYALTHSDKFRCGIAGSGVFAWELYDTIYTERYMATPQNNPEGYAISSVIKAAKDLKGELLITHGTMDDNVHMQNAIQLIDALQRAGKQNFTFMLYPKSRHGVGGGHVAELRRRFMREHL